MFRCSLVLSNTCRRKFRSQTSDNMDRWKAELGRGREKRRVEERRSEKRKSQKKEDADARKGRTVAKHCVFQWFVAPEGRKVGSLKRRVRSQLATWDMKKVHAVVARSTFRRKNVQNTSASDHFWKLRCRKSACRCGAKHISKGKCTKHLSLGPLLEVAMSKKCMPLWREAHFEVQNVKHLSIGPLLEVAMSKKCMPLWREAHFEVNMYKTPQYRTTFGSWDVEKAHAVVGRSTVRSENGQNTTCSRHFWRFRCRSAWQVQGIVDLVKSEQNVRVL